MKNLTIDFISGTLSSFINTCIGYPFDFIKTRLQISSTNQGALKTATAIIKKEGIKALYSGMSAQLANSILAGAFYFTTFEQTRRSFARYNGLNDHSYIKKHQTFISGSCAGIVSDFFMVPFEYVKILSQKESLIKESPFHRILKIIKTEGFFQLYKGCKLQMIRDSIGCGCYFLAHSQTLKYFTPEGLDRQHATQFGILSASIMAGASYWVVSYPIDIIKTRVQTSQMDITTTIKCIYENGGILKFYNGYKITMIRSVLVNIFALQSYEHIRRSAYNYL